MAKKVQILLLLLSNNIVFCFSEIEFTDEEYFKMPDIIDVDNYQKCLVHKDGVFCFGSFIISGQQSLVFVAIKKYSENTRSYLNHTQIQRGLCLSKSNIGRCFLNSSLSWAESFESCVNEDIQKRYGLRAKLNTLDYCKNYETRRKMDYVDYLFIFYVIFILCLNFIGTVYGEIVTGTHWLLCFSLRVNWHTLTANEANENNSEKFKSLNGLRVILALAVILAHSTMTAFYVSANPLYMEQASRRPEMIILFNGNLLVTIFFVISSFLRAHKICVDDKTSKPYFRIITRAFVDRIVRISPLYITVLCYSATLAAFTSDGPFWAKYVESEANKCRQTYWKHLLLIQNFYNLSLCLPQTWYLATDFQLYVICTALMTISIRRKNKSIFVLCVILIGSLIALGIMVYILELESSLFYIAPQTILNLFVANRSYVLLHESIWGNFPSAVVGLIAGMVYYLTKNNDSKLNNKMFAILCQLSIPLAISYIAMGYVVQSSVTSRLGVTIYSTLDKAGFALVSVFIVLGSLLQKNVFYRSFLEWNGWTVLSRLSYASLLTHYTINKAIIGSRIFPTTLSTISIVSDWFGTAVITFLISIPLVLMVEFPFTQLYKYFTSSSNKLLLHKKLK